MRDDKWLLAKLDHLWSNYFPDISQENPVFIHFGRFARLRFGSIKMDGRKGHTYIIVTGMFKDEKIPEAVVEHTIAHELCHYVHGFSSPRVRMHRYPHEGGIIKKEMEKRGLIHLVKSYRKWIREYRQQLYKLYNQKRRKGW